MNKPAILVEDVAVRFRPYLDRKPTLRRTLSQLRSREQAEVTALEGISFRVEQGEAFGLIGANGAGKSTLLRVIARTMKPDEGRVVVNGRTSTLLQLGVGFNPQLSGSRNVYLGGLAAGMSRKEVDAVYDDIVEFAGLGEAIYRPMKTYSSGMFSRLAFSVSMHLDPDVLLLDEVLAVGDEAFRRKSIAVMRGLLDQSGTIIFVSHSLPSVAEFCDRALWLDSGRIRMLGPADAVVDAYIEETGGTPRRAPNPRPAEEGVLQATIDDVRNVRDRSVESLNGLRVEKEAVIAGVDEARRAEKAAEGELAQATQRVQNLLAQREKRRERRAIRDAQRLNGQVDGTSTAGGEPRESTMTREEADVSLADEIADAHVSVNDARTRLYEARAARSRAVEEAHRVQRAERTMEAEVRRTGQRLEKLASHRERQLERRAAKEAERWDADNVSPLTN